jgi:hypothetical protein
MGAPVRNQKAQLRGQQDPQRFYDHLGRHLRPSDKQWQSQALPGAIVGHNQNGNPSSDDRQLREPFPETAPFLPPLFIFLCALCEGGLVLSALRSPPFILGFSLRRWLCRLGCLFLFPFSPESFPGGIFQRSLLAYGTAGIP